MRKKVTQQNYLDKIPVRNPNIAFNTDEKGIVILEIENKGIMNRMAQKLFKKPKISYVHLDEMGSFIWPLIDGQRNIEELGVLVEEHFGERAHPLYERLVKYLKILESYGFINYIG